MDDYRERVVESLSRATGMSVSARAIRGGWEGLRPYISLQGFAINHLVVDAPAGRRALP